MVVGRVLRPHGVRGEVTVEVRTDDPGRRFAVGSVLGTDPQAAEPLTVESARWHAGRLVVGFAGVADRTRAESLRGTWLTVDAAAVAHPEHPDEFHDQQLVGLSVVTVSGEHIGAVTGVRHHGQDLLVVGPTGDAHRRGEVLVPFVAAIVVEVDVPAGRLVIDPPPGLLELGSGSGGGGRRGGPGRG